MAAAGARSDFCGRLAGAALGLMCGDALGMPLEGISAPEIAARHGLPGQMLAGRLPAGCYTDDSQMMIGILETLAARGGLDPAHLAGRFAANFDPARGYGGRLAGVVERIRAGANWRETGTDSFGNGGAMRVGVLGVFYMDNPQALDQAALDQCRITHTHPQALAGALALAMAGGQAARAGATGQTLEAGPFMEKIVRRVEGIDSHTASRLAALPRLVAAGGGAKAVRARLVGEYRRDLTAPESVPPAIGAFLAGDSAPRAISLAASLGNDTDTMAAMAGALAGAFWGLAALPGQWLAALENGPQGRDYVLSLCRQIADGRD